MFANTIVRPTQRSASIIIKFDDKRGVSEFQLPLGMEAFPENDYTLKKQLFFKTYQTYRKFIQEKIQSIESQKWQHGNETIDQDTVTETETSYQFKNSTTNENISYQKLLMFDSILNAYDELKIHSLQNKISKTENIDYSKIHRYLNNAVYLRNNALYIDAMDLPKKILKDASTELVEMFCYIYYEIIKELDVEPSNPLILPLANSFKERRLFEESSLFAEDIYDDTLSILKSVLEEIDQTTAYKDTDYWHFYDAVHHFLYSNNDGEWAIDNFPLIWERMCLAHATKYYRDEICLYDDFGILKTPEEANSVKDYYTVSMNIPNSIKRYLRPDLVLEKPSFILVGDFMERLYNVVRTVNEINLSKIPGNDYRHFGDIEKLKIDMFKDKPRIRDFFAKLQKYPPTFTISEEEYISFKESARDLLQNHRSYFELIVRSPILVQKINEKSNNEFLIVDYKYMTDQAFQLPLNDFVQKAVTKQYVYELALKLNRNAITYSEFWIPGFISNKFNAKNKSLRKYLMSCDTFFKKYRISIIQLDFLELQKNYVENDF